MLSAELENCLNKAFQLARDGRHEFLTVEHLLSSILETTAVKDVLASCGADVAVLAKDLLDATHRRGAAAINARLNLAVDRLATATGGAREVGPLAAICDALRMSIEATKAEALP